jgi:hypothetical protein
MWSGLYQLTLLILSARLFLDIIPEHGHKSRFGGELVQRLSCIACKFFVILLPLIAVSELSVAGEAPCAGSEYRQFDFWLGRWIVEVGGDLVGRNEINRRHDGCLLEENWTSVNGGTGSSMNFYDPAEQQWRQIWVSGGTVIDIAGGLEDTSMRLTGTITYLAEGARLPFRGLWTPLIDGRVRQYFEEQRDGRWQVWFEGFYRKDVE